MSVFDKLLHNLFEPDQIQPKELSDQQARKRVEDTGRSVSGRINEFARRYLAPDTYERYRSSLKNLRYDVAKLPSRVITFFNMLTGEVKRVVEGALALYDEERNRIVANRYVANDPDKGQLEPTIAHEEVHHATKEWLKSYFKRFGEKARPVIEGFTELINTALGYGTGAYPELVYGAYQTLQRLGSNVRDNLYRVLNFQISPETVLNTFYQSLEGLQNGQPVYVLAEAR